MNILIIGTGYVGLVTAACFAEKGHFVVCIDIDQKKIDLLNQGIIPFYEPGLSELVLKNSANGHLRFTSSYPSQIAPDTLCFLALPTPSLPDGSCDNSYLKKAIAALAPTLIGYTVIVNKSTAPMGTTKEIEQWIRAANSKVSFDVVSNPEFLKEGAAVHDCLNPDRVIIGTLSEKASFLLKDLYSSFISPEQILVMTPASAELTKYASNAMLALRISFMNEIAGLCEQTGANVQEVKLGVGSDSRIGNKFLNAGIGYGGSCFPKDIRALSALSKLYQTPSCILDAIEETNERQKQILFVKMTSTFASQGGLSKKQIAIWGLSFKPETDDMREAPSLHLIASLLQAGAFVKVYDPAAMNNAKKLLLEHPHLTFANDPYEAARQADAIALMTEWSCFSSIDFSHLIPSLNQTFFFDGRNLYNPDQMQDLGFHYVGIGLPEALRVNNATTCLSSSC